MLRVLVVAYQQTGDVRWGVAAASASDGLRKVQINDGGGFHGVKETAEDSGLLGLKTSWQDLEQGRRRRTLTVEADGGMPTRPPTSGDEWGMAPGGWGDDRVGVGGRCEAVGGRLRSWTAGLCLHRSGGRLRGQEDGCATAYIQASEWQGGGVGAGARRRGSWGRRRRGRERERECRRRETREQEGGGRHRHQPNAHNMHAPIYLSIIIFKKHLVSHIYYYSFILILPH